MTTRIRFDTRAFALALALCAGCLGRDEAPEEDEGFVTSGSREADQRAEQRISKEQQLRGEGQDGDKEKPVKKTLYERLGSTAGIDLIVDDFVDRVIADPRTNWERKGVKRGGVLGLGGNAAEWKATEENVAGLKKHLAQFIAVATGGPIEYEGRKVAEVHDGMKITNAEFDASIGALKASLDALRVPLDEQKELLAVFESTRPQIAEKR
jgi:hemoglobin